MPHQTRLSRRERQILDILYRAGKARAAEVHAALPDRPSYSAVRASLRILEQKGHARHEEQGTRYLFAPTEPCHKARQSALRHLLDTFFQGSTEQAVAALLDGDASRLSEQELARLADLIARARKEGR